MMRIAAAFAVVGLAMAGPVQAQTAAKPAAAKPAAAKPAAARAGAYRAARLPGTTHPDLNGVWQVMNQAGWDIEPHAARAALQLRPGPFVPVPAKDVLALGAVGAVPAGNGVVEGGEIPYKPEKKAQRDENRKNYTDLDKGDPEVKCYLPGVPRANYMHLPFQVFQSEKSMIIAYEYAGAVRNVMFTDPGPAPVDSWMGQSVAKWDGDTLVVTVTGQLDRSWLDRAGNFHSDQMVVVERWTPTSPTTMRYEATITDPETFTRPWKVSMNLYKHVGEDARLNQFKCVEFVEELMYGKLRKEPLK
jgi:hypothetical protein